MTTKVYVGIDLGVDRSAWEAAYALDQRNDRLPYGVHHLEEHGFTLSFLRPRRELLPELYLAEALRRVSRNMNLWSLAEGWRLRRDADVTFAWEERVGMPMALARRIGDPPCVTGVLWLTDRYEELPEYHRAVCRRALRSAAAIVITSRPQRQLLVDQWGVDPDRVHYLRFGIAAEQWTKPSDSAQRPALVVSAGNDEHRDHPLLVRALERVRSAGRTVHLDLLTKQEIAVPAALGVRRVTAGVAETRDAYHASALVAVCTTPNTHVSGVTVSLEAMAAGRAVISSDNPGIDDYVIDGETGFLVPPGDEQALAARIEQLLGDPDLARRMGEAGRRRVLERHTTATMAADLAPILHAAAAERH